MEFKPIGFKYFHFTDTDETILITRPKNSANNLIMGHLYIDVHGDMILENQKTKEIAKIHFSKKGWTDKKKCKFDGKVLDAKGKEKVQVYGNWHDKMFIKDLTSGKEEVVWHASPKVENSEK